MTRFAGQTAIITGGARGIGAAISRKLLHDGAQVIAWDPAPCEDALLHAAPDGRLHHMAVDVTDLAAVERAAADVQSRFGAPRILVNNAGIAGANHKLHEYPVAEWRRVIEINLMGVFHACHAVVPLMVAAKTGGRVVNVASIAGKEGNPLASGYSASKAGVIALTKSLGKELVDDNILVNCIAPAAIETELLKQSTQQFVDYMISKIPMKRLGKVEEVAALVAFLCSDECSFSTGATFDLSGGRATY